MESVKESITVVPFATMTRMDISNPVGWEVDRGTNSVPELRQVSWPIDHTVREKGDLP